jgi:hypothetical protein
MSGLSRNVTRIGVIAGWMLLVLAPAGAAEGGTLPPETPSHQTVPEAASPGSGGGEPLSDKLDRQGGVIRPPGGIDPNMTQSPPAVGRTPVIPPPGTPGGEQGVRPK